MLRLTFDTAQHTAALSENGVIIADYQNVSTIKQKDDVYEIIVKHDNDMQAPVCKVPVVNTIMFLSHGY